MEIKVSSVSCPVCNVGEMEPEDTRTDIQWFEKFVAIRGFKVTSDPADGWWSECLHCREMFGNGWFSESGRVEKCLLLDIDSVVNRRQLLIEYGMGEGPFTAEQRKEWLAKLEAEHTP